jgi:hypothetical protein
MTGLPSKKRWSELSPTQRNLITLAGIVQISLLIAALIDIRRRPAGKVNGSKTVWTAASFVNYIGPIAWFLFGRRR